MVRAIIEGRKTQTRRVVKPQPYRNQHDNCWEWNGWGGADDGDMMAGRFGQFLLEQCPCGQPGDKLWVRETWGLMSHHDPTDWCAGSIRGVPESEIREQYSIEHADNWKLPSESAHWRPSIFMPRWASRITLEIESVRVERVQDITEEDAKAEGSVPQFRTVIARPDGGPNYHIPVSYRGGFANLWDSINSSRGFGWDSNPWVWVINFKRV